MKTKTYYVIKSLNGLQTVMMVTKSVAKAHDYRNEMNKKRCYSDLPYPGLFSIAESN